jgi:hypothetical protein
MSLLGNWSSGVLEWWSRGGAGRGLVTSAPTVGGRVIWSSREFPGVFEKGVELGFADVTLEGLHHILFEVTFGLDAIDSEVARADAKGAELLCQPEVGNGFALAGFGPGMVRKIIEALDQDMAEKAVGLELDEEQEDIEEQSGGGIDFAGGGRDADGGLAGEIGPVAAREVGESKEGFPDVSGAVIEFTRWFGLGIGDLYGVVGDEAGAFSLKVGGLEVAKAGTLFVAGFALHAEDDTAVGEGDGEATNAGDDFGTPTGVAGEAKGLGVGIGRGSEVRARLIVGAQDEGGFFVVTGIENAPEFGIALEEGIGLVDQQSEADFFGEAEDGGGSGVGSDDGVESELAQDGDKGGLAATMLWGFDTQVSGDVPEVIGIRVKAPEREGFRRPFGQDDKGPEDQAQLIQKEFAIDGFRPGLGSAQTEEAGDGGSGSLEGRLRLSYGCDR